ncbi:Glu/Leu/Phe/Val dehydrogenase dimerization domain-containing protein [Georgenia sp. Z1344]|uniref:Glu/Leu/Phe/Val dehydrogenase dimerization domain-containing protein n=1 Tax=Georgenia sp. Z1344 TaxID=3416706 RepID=UPI003CF1B09F
MTTIDDPRQGTPISARHGGALPSPLGAQHGVSDALPGTPLAPAPPRPHEPYQKLTWVDPVTGVHGYLVVDTLLSGLATGGTRMRAGCTMREVGDLARGMSLKTSTFGIPVGGAKGGIDLDPKDPRAEGVLERFYDAMRPWLDSHWVTADDLGVDQHRLDAVFDRLGLIHSYGAAIRRAADPAATYRRVRAAIDAPVSEGLHLGDMIGGYGVAQACLAAVRALGPGPGGTTTVAVQGVGTMGGGTAWYLHEAGAHVVALADAAGTLYHPGGLDVPALLALRDAYGEIDRTRVPDDVEQLPRDAVLRMHVDVLVPAAVSYAIGTHNADEVNARVVVEAANAAVVPEAEPMLAARHVPVVPDFVANAGAATCAWWLLLGMVGPDPADSLRRLRREMRTLVGTLLEQSRRTGATPREVALVIAEEHRIAVGDSAQVVIP